MTEADHEAAESGTGGPDPELTVLELLGPSTGGIRVHVASLAAGLTARGVRAPVVGPRDVMAGLGPQAGIVAVPRSLSPVPLRRARRSLNPWRSQAQVIHAHGLKAAWVAINGRPRRPVVVTVHNVVLEASAGRASGVKQRLERFVLGRAERVIAPTRAIAARLDGTVDRSRLRVVAPVSPRPVPRRPRAEVRAAWGVADDTAVVVSVTRLHPQKDLATLMRAWAVVTASHPDARLVVVGEGPARGELEGLVRTLGIEGSVALVGFSSHAVDELAAADVMALSSLWEAIPLVLTEAMQLGLPVVSTDVGLAAELLTPEAGGSVVAVGDAVGLATGIIALLDDPARARRIGEAGRRVAERKFDEASLVDEVIDVYRELV